MSLQVAGDIERQKTELHACIRACSYMLVYVCMVAHVRLHLFVSIGCVHVFAQLQYISQRHQKCLPVVGKQLLVGSQL